jgi:soluble lytic murein transglycosylase-like protein
MAKQAWIAASVALVLGSSAADAAPHKRGVVLLNFLTSPATDGTALPPSEDLSSVARAMANEFTGAAETPSIGDGAFGRVRPTVNLGAAQFGNPFVTYALSRRPIEPVFASSFSNGDDCAVPTYRPSIGFGRSAEERRRMVFPLVQQAACEVGLPIALFDAMIMQESRYQPAALSPKGAFGLAQLMPGTARGLNVDRYRLLDNLRGGAKYLKQHMNRFGRVDLALAAYNAGPGRVERSREVPRIAETQNYVRKIMANWTGGTPSAEGSVSPHLYRQAQLIFMPARPAQF